MLAYMALFKLRSVALNLLSALVGLLLAAGSGIPWDRASFLLVGGGLVAAGCGAVNSYLDRDIDRVMSRTARRPLPLGRIKPAAKALYLGLFLIVIGLLISLVWLNWLTTLFMVAGATIYLFVYTVWLKRKTPWSVVIGGLAGCCALLAGWFSVAVGWGLPPLIFSIFIFLWTPGHFWGLAIRTKDDSERARIPTLPVIYGEKTAARWAALSNMALVPLSAIPYALGVLGEAYLIISLVIGIAILIPNIRLYFAPTVPRAWAVFKVSNPYLAVIYLAVAVDIFLV